MAHLVAGVTPNFQSDIREFIENLQVPQRPSPEFLVAGIIQGLAILNNADYVSERLTAREWYP